MEEGKIVIPVIMQWGAMGILVILSVGAYIKEKMDNHCLAKKLAAVQEQRVVDAKDVNKETTNVLLVLKDKITELCFEVKSLKGGR